MASITHQIKELEELADFTRTIREEAKTEGGRLTEFGQDFVHICVKNEFKVSFIAKMLAVTASAISQRAAQIKE